MHVLEERCCSRTRLNCLLDERTQGKCEYFHDRLSGSYLHAKPLADWCVSWKNKTCARIKFLIIILNDHFSIVSNSFFSISYALIYFWGAFAVLYVPSRACVSEALGRIDWKNEECCCRLRMKEREKGLRQVMFFTMLLWSRIYYPSHMQKMENNNLEQRSCCCHSVLLKLSQCLQWSFVRRCQ